MSLDFQPLSIVFTGGLDTKSDAKAVQATKLRELQNGVFTKPGLIARRFGHDILERSIVGSTSTISAAQSIAVFDDELLLFSGTRVYSRSIALSSWLDRGSVSVCATKEIPILRNSASQSNVDVAVNAGIRLVAWEDSRGGVRYSVQDAASGAFFVADVLAKSTATQPKCIAFGTELVLFYTAGANLYYRRISTLTPTVVGVEVNPVSTMDATNNRYDVTVGGVRIFVAWNDTSAGSTLLSYLDTAFALASPTSSIFARAAPTAIGLLNIAETGLTVLLMVDGTGVYARAFTYALAPSTGMITVEATTFASRVAAAVASTTTVTVFYEMIDPATNAQGGAVRSSVVDLFSGIAGTPADVVRGVGLWAKPVTYNGVIYLGIARQSSYQSVFFVIDSTGLVVAKVAPDVSGGLRTKPTLAEFAQVSAGLYEIGYVELGRYVVDEGAPGYALPGAKVIRVDFTAKGRYQTAKLRNNLLIGGGVVQMYDGATLGEAGFHQWPEGITQTAATAPAFAVTTPGDGTHKETSTVTFAANTYIAPGQYFLCHTALDAVTVAVYYTIDGVKRDPAVAAATEIEVSILSTDSATSIATKTATAMTASGLFTSAVGVGTVLTIVNLANGAATDIANGPAPYGVCTGVPAGTYQYTAIYERTDNFGQVHRSAPATPITVTGTGVAMRVKIPTLRITSWANVRVVLYRTKNNGTVFHRLTPIASPLANDKTADAVYPVDGFASDTDIAPLEALYTTGGLLEANAPVSSNLLVTYKDRVFLSGEANPYALRYSTVTAVGEAVAFNDTLSITVDQRGGPITALTVLDDKLLIFKESAIFMLAGDGPSNTGDGQDYGAPALVTTDTGCSNPSSIVTTPQGVMFQTPKGFYLLDRGMNCQYLGEQIERYNNSAVTGALVAPNTNQIRFVSSDAPGLVFDYLAGEWATFTNFEAVGCAVWRGAAVFVKSDGRVFVENQAKWVDGDARIPLVIVTAHIVPSGLQEWFRVRELRVLGTYKGPHDLRVSVATDYNETFTQVHDFDATAEFAASAYGVASPYGSGGVYGGAWKVYNFRLRPVRAKVTAICVRIEDTQASAYNEGMAINGLALYVGMKKGLARVPASRSA